MISLIIYLICFVVLFFITRQEYKNSCFILISLISLQLILSYYASIGKITDILFYLISLSFIDLLMVSCSIVNNFVLKDYNVFMSIIAVLAVFSTILCIFDFYKFYYFQYSPMVVMEYLYFSLKPQDRCVVLYYLNSSMLLMPHTIT